MIFSPGLFPLGAQLLSLWFVLVCLCLVTPASFSFYILFSANISQIRKRKKMCRREAPCPPPGPEPWNLELSGSVLFPKSAGR